MKYFLSFDVGTTAMKCILFDTGFNQAAKVSKEYSLVIENGYTELDPEVYYNTLCTCISEILNTGVNRDDILSITFTTQGETFLCVDKGGKPLTRAVIWLDARADSEAKFILNNIGTYEFYKTTGLWTPDGALPLAKLLHIKKNTHDVYEKTYKFLLLEDYLVYRLTGKYVTEKSLASSTGWYDIINDGYYKDALRLCGISEKKFPELSECGETVGTVKDEFCGLSEKTVVVTGAMDQICSAIGAGNMHEGVVTETTGTALVIGASIDIPQFDESEPITVYRHFNGKYMYMPYCGTAGILLKWFKDVLGEKICRTAKENGISPYAEIDIFAEKSPPGSNGVIFLPDFSDPGKKGAFLGLTLATTLEDMSRSVLEGIGYMLREMLEQLSKKGIDTSEIYSLGGGSASEIWCKIKSSVCNAKIFANTFGETTALGAAVLAAVALGEYESAEKAYATVKTPVKPYVPDEKEREIYNRIYEELKK